MLGKMSYLSIKNSSPFRKRLYARGGLKALLRRKFRGPGFILFAFFVGWYFGPMIDFDLTRRFSFEGQNYSPIIYHRNTSLEGKDFLSFSNLTTCSPQKHIFYLKTYKTASTTLSAMFFRYAIRHGLTILPVYEDPYPNTITIDKIVDPMDGSTRSGPYDIFAEHIIYNKSAVSKFVKPDSMYIMSLRHPFSQLRSYFRERTLMDKFGIYPMDPVGLFLRSIQANPHLYHSLANLPSVTSHQLGLKPDDKYNVEAIERLIKSLDEQFSAVVITEYFDESMVIMRRKLCWSLRDIVYIVERKRVYKPIVYNYDLRKTYESWSFADYVLYYHNYNRLFKSLSIASPDLAEEINHFKTVLILVRKFCSDIIGKLMNDAHSIYELAGDLDTGEGRSYITVEASPWNKEFTLDAVECALMSISSKVLRNLARLRQMPQLCSPHTQRVRQSKFYGAYMESPNKAHIHPQFCGPTSLFYKIPLDVLARANSYMWSFMPDLDTDEDDAN